MTAPLDTWWRRVRSWPFWVQALLWVFFPYVLAIILIWRTQWASWTKWLISGTIGLFVVAAAAGAAQEPKERGAEEQPNQRSIESEEPSASEDLPDTYSRLQLTDVNQVNGQVVVEGITDLPTGSVVSVDFSVPTKPNDPYIGVDTETRVEDGVFSAQLKPPQRKEFESGPYVVSVLFTPRAQNDDVLSLVGQDGENLSGRDVEESFGFNLMRVKQRTNLDLAVAVPSYPFDRPGQFAPNSPENVVARFAMMWRGQDWAGMAETTQITWRETEDRPERILRNWYGFKTLKGFEVLGSEENSAVSVDVTFRVWYEAFTNQIEEHEITARVLKESAPYEPDLSGTWGVNPLSTLRED